MFNKHKLDIDITPLSVDEVEKFCFESRRVYFEELGPDLREDLESIISRTFVSALGDPDYLQARLPSLLNKFNSVTLPKYIKGYLCKEAKADYKINTLSPLDIDLWIDYLEIDFRLIKRLPIYIRQALEDRYA